MRWPIRRTMCCVPSTTGACPKAANCGQRRRPRPLWAKSNSLWAHATRQPAWLLAEKPPPQRTLTLREVIRRIAMQGGFLARKGDAELGVKTLRQDFARLTSFARGGADALDSCVMNCVEWYAASARQLSGLKYPRRMGVSGSWGYLPWPTASSRLWLSRHWSQNWKSISIQPPMATDRASPPVRRRRRRVRAVGAMTES